MFDIEDRSHQPKLHELSEFVQNPLFDSLCQFMSSEYKAIQQIEYSGDKILLGWNLKFKKGGRTLCTVYPRHGHFPMLLIVGKKEKERVEALLPSLSEEFCKVYNSTPEGMGQRWLLLDFFEPTAMFYDALKIIKIRRNLEDGIICNEG